MQQWEYFTFKVLKMNKAEPNKPDPTIVVIAGEMGNSIIQEYPVMNFTAASNGKDMLPDFASAIGTFVREVGRSGWELVTINQDSVWVFKRPMQEPEKVEPAEVAKNISEDNNRQENQQAVAQELPF